MAPKLSKSINLHPRKKRTCDIKNGRSHYGTIERDSLNVAAGNTTVMTTCAGML